LTFQYSSTTCSSLIATLHYYRSLILTLAYRQTGINVNFLVLLTPQSIDCLRRVECYCNDISTTICSQLYVLKSLGVGRQLIMQVITPVLTFRRVATSPWCLHLAVRSTPSLELLEGEHTLKFVRLSETTKAVWYWVRLRGLPLHHIQVAG
jgi:hypothetical protein